jgi:hypothetical protein
MLTGAFAFAGVAWAGILPPGVTTTDIGPNGPFPDKTNYSIDNFKQVVSAEYGAVYTGGPDVYGYDETNSAYTPGQSYFVDVADAITNVFKTSPYIWVLPAYTNSTIYSTPNLGGADPLINTYKTLTLVYEATDGNTYTLTAHDFDEITLTSFGPGTESFPIQNASPGYFEQFASK